MVMIAAAGRNVLIGKTLNSLQRCTKPDSFQGVIVIENGQKYGVEEIVNEYRESLKAKYFYYSRGNKSAALNYGLTFVDNPNTLVYFTDDDVELSTSTLIATENAARNKIRGYFFGGATRAIYEKKPPRWLILSFPASAQGWYPGDNEDYKLTARFLGFNWAAFAGDIKALGGFNESLGPGTKPKRTGQEWDMQNRMLKEGFKAVFVEDAVVHHFVPESRSNFRWLMKRRFEDGMGVGITYAHQNPKIKIPDPLIRYAGKHILMLLPCLLSFSKSRMVNGLGNVMAGFGRMKGYIEGLLKLNK